MKNFPRYMLGYTTAVQIVLIPMILIVMSSACSQVPVVYTVSAGSHIRLTDEELANRQKSPRRRFVVWGNHQGATNSAIQLIQQFGGSVVERARLQTLFEEQKMILTHSSDDSATLLKVGKLVDADVVVFVETTESAESHTPSISTMENVAMRLQNANAVVNGGTPLWMQMQKHQQHIRVYRPGVMVRAVKVETGEIEWSGSSTLSQGVTDPELAYPILTQAAMHRAACLVEKGATWVEAASDGSVKQWGCISK
ncbi:MAG: hypothetical protein NDI90_15225 [Nitrospira sp. BO4]|jgi:hypothetical protein|nr:hypothetical protein [Nitrospira sp. BO4]